MPVIHSLADGYDVFFVTDASGGVSREARDMAVVRMVQAGAVPITWIAVMSEWQRDWARESTVPAIAEITVAHGGASGVAFAWEQQTTKLRPEITAMREYPLRPHSGGTTSSNGGQRV